jgi:hypothetical protein
MPWMFSEPISPLHWSALCPWAQRVLLLPLPIPQEALLRGYYTRFLFVLFQIWISVWIRINVTSFFVVFHKSLQAQLWQYLQSAVHHIELQWNSDITLPDVSFSRIQSFHFFRAWINLCYIGPRISRFHVRIPDDCNPITRCYRPVAYVKTCHWYPQICYALRLITLIMLVIGWNVDHYYYYLPPLWSHISWQQIQKSWFLFPALPDFQRSSGAGTRSTQPPEHNWGATWMRSSGPDLENRD